MGMWWSEGYLHSKLIGIERFTFDCVRADGEFHGLCDDQ